MTGNPDASGCEIDIEKLLEYIIDLYKDNPDVFAFDEELQRLIETVIGNREDDYGGE
jgi:hypothetical protein